jgi:hypothetical protein
MSLSDLASLGSFISGLAVLVSLVFLYFQVRQINAQVLQAERNQRALIEQGRVDRVTDISMRVAADPALSELYSKGMRTPEDLSLPELDRFLHMSRANFLSGEDSFLQYKEALLDEEAYRSALAAASYQLANPGLRAAWRMTSRTFAPAYRDFMEDLVRAAGRAGQSGAERLEQWKAAVQFVRAEG